MFRVLLQCTVNSRNKPAQDTFCRQSKKNTNYGAHRFVIKYLLTIDNLNCLKDRTILNGIFYMCSKNFQC